jgi:hypothetical protein
MWNSPVSTVGSELPPFPLRPGASRRDIPVSTVGLDILSAPPFGAFTASLAERQQSPIADTGKFHILSAQTDDK